MLKNIDKIVDNALCTGCGACAAICPTSAIKMCINKAGFLIAKVDKDKCINCGKCLSICPSNCENSIEYNGKEIFYGDIKKCYIGYSNDAEIRIKSQSGGIVTALLLYMLEQKIIDGALVNKFDKETKRSKIIFAKTRQQLLDSAGSIYIQSPVSEEAIKYSKYNKIATVLLGCQAEGLKNIMKKYPSIKTPFINIGLFCAGQNSSLMIEDLIGHANIDSKEKICNFRFKDKSFGNWPGNTRIDTDKRSYEINKQVRQDYKNIYESIRCKLCFDQLNIFSDISVGDPWGINIKKLEKGYSVIIVRNKKAQEIIDNAAKQKYISIQEISCDSLLNGQTIDKRLIPKFYNSMNIYSNNNWLYPYDKRNFIKYEEYKKNLKVNKKISGKYSNARKFYLEKDEKNIKKHIINTKKHIKLKKIIDLPLYYLKRIIARFK